MTTTVLSNARSRRWLAEELACGAWHDAVQYLTVHDDLGLSEAQRAEFAREVSDAAFQAALDTASRLRREQRGVA